MLGDKMYPYFNDYIDSVAAAGQIDADDVRAIRTVLAEEIPVNRSLLEKLIDLDRSASGGSAWRRFLAETVADFVVWVESPLGRVPAESAAWLIGALHGPAETMAPHAAGVAQEVVGEAEEVDPSLTMFVLSLPSNPNKGRGRGTTYERSTDFAIR